MRGVSLDYMKDKLQTWHPTWNIESKTPDQIRAIYRKEQQKIIKDISHSLFFPPKAPH